MSKEFKNIDDLFQSSFEGEMAEVPAFVKVNIDKQITTGNNKKGWWMIGSILAIFIVIGTIYTFHSNDNSNSISNTNFSTNQTHSDILDKNETTNTLTASDENFESIETNQEALTTSNQKINSTQKSDIENQLNKQDQFNTASNPTNDVEKTKLDTKKVGNKSDKTGNDVSKEDEQHIETSNSIDLVKNADLENYRNSISLKSNFLNVGIKNSITPLKSFSFVPKEAPTRHLSNEKSAISITKNETYNPWMISVFGGAAFVQSAYNSTNSNEVDLYKNSNKDKPGFESGIDVSYRLKNAITFGSGLAYSQLSQDYTYFKEQVNIDSTITWTYQDIYEYDTILDSNIFIGIDSISTTNYDTSSVTLYDQSGQTKASYIHLPFRIGAQLVSNKFIFDFYVAGRFNYLISASGGYVENDAYTSFTKNSGQLFKPWYIDLMIGTAVHFMLTDHLYISGTLKYCPSLSNIYEGVSFSRTVQSAKLGLGISWKL